LNWKAQNKIHAGTWLLAYRRPLKWESLVSGERSMAEDWVAAPLIGAKIVGPKAIPSTLA